MPCQLHSIEYFAANTNKYLTGLTGTHVHTIILLNILLIMRLNIQ